MHDTHSLAIILVGDSEKMIKSSTIETAKGPSTPTWDGTQISCGCCRNGCVCLNHMDIPRGIRPQLCEQHSGSGAIRFLKGGAA